MVRKRFTKAVWKNAIGACLKPKRLKLKHNKESSVPFCEQEEYRSKRGCRKHVHNKHGWFYFFNQKPDVEKVFPSLTTRENTYELQKRAKTSAMPAFLKSCKVGQEFKNWLQSPGGGGKSLNQAEQTLSKSLKYLKFCCADVSSSWDIPETVVDYCLGSLTMLSDFVNYLQNEWKVRYAGMIGYINSIGQFLDFRRTVSKLASKNGISIYSV